MGYQELLWSIERTLNSACAKKTKWMVYNSGQVVLLVVGIEKVEIEHIFLVPSGSRMGINLQLDML